MKRNNDNTNSLIDGGLTDIRNTRISSEQVEQAAARVLANLQAENNKVVLHPAAIEAQAGDRIRNCSDFQALIPAYLSSSLTPSRKLLFEDHTRNCVVCRKAVSVARGHHPKPESSRPLPRIERSRGWQLAALAAAVLLVVTLTQMNGIRDFVWPIDVHAVAQTVNGGLVRVSGQDIRAVAAGERIERHQAVRTGNDSGAVLELADGSRIEMNSRSELSLDRANDGVRIQLARGSVIVTAAKQRTGHLYVATNDCLVSVVGTVFSVNSGIKGSRVSVVEGEVHVQQGSSSQALLPGQQAVTTTAMGNVPVQDEIAWSRDRDLHLAQLKELVAFSQDLGRRLGAQEMRRTSNLVPLVPANTLLFASLPNVSQPVAESYAAMKQRISENPALQQWWSQNAGGDHGMSVDEMINRVTKVGAYLGPEIVLAFSPDQRTDPSALLLADVARPAELTAALMDSLSRVSDLADNEVPVRLVHTPAELAALPSVKESLVIYTDQQLMVAALNPQQIQRVLASKQSGTNAFASTALYPRVAQAYNQGVGWLVAADLQQLMKRDNNPASSPEAGDIQQLVMEQKTGSAGSSYQAVLGFNQVRTGPAAWLGSPGTVGAAEFVSPNAYGVAAIVTKDPALIIDDIFKMLQGSGDFQALQQFQQDHHVDVRYDLAAPLGNEFLLAVDGPILPTPAWKLVIEVNDAARLQNSLQWAVAEINREAATRQKPGISASTQVVGGRTFYALKSAELPVEIHYTFWAGYLIVSPNRTLLEEAIQYRDTGNSLARSDHFRSQFPGDGRDNASGFIYQNLQAMASMIPVEGIKEAVGNALPSLVCLYGETDRIVLSSKGVLGTNIASMAGLTGMIHAIGIR